MTPLQTARIHERFFVNAEAAEALAANRIVHEVDRAGNPHLLISVPDLEKARKADVGIEIDRGEDDSLSISVLIYDIPDEPVVYEMTFNPHESEDLMFLRSVIETSLFRMHPCQQTAEGWEVGGVQVFKVPPSVLLKLKHCSLSWDDSKKEKVQDDSDNQSSDSSVQFARTPDARDTVIRKLKEQVDALRAQLQEKDKRIIDLEESLHQIKSKGRGYKLTSERKSWWKPFA